MKAYKVGENVEIVMGCLKKGSAILQLLMNARQGSASG